MEFSGGDHNRPHHPPGWTVGGLNTSRLVLARTATVVATMDQFIAWPQGVQFTVLVQTRGITWDSGMDRPPIVFCWDPARYRNEVSGTFDVEISYPGRPSADISFERGSHPPANDDGGDPVLTMLGGSGSVDDQEVGRWECRFWLTPLPPAGAAIRTTWTSGNIDQTCFFDADALRLAAAEAQVFPA